MTRRHPEIMTEFSVVEETRYWRMTWGYARANSTQRLEQWCALWPWVRAVVERELGKDWNNERAD